MAGKIEGLSCCELNQVGVQCCDNRLLPCLTVSVQRPPLPPHPCYPSSPQVDRESATPERCAQVETQLFDVFASLGADDDQLNFMEGRLLYASGRGGAHLMYASRWSEWSEGAREKLRFRPAMGKGEGVGKMSQCVLGSVEVPYICIQSCWPLLHSQPNSLPVNPPLTSLLSPPLLPFHSQAGLVPQ